MRIRMRIKKLLSVIMTVIMMCQLSIPVFASVNDFSTYEIYGYGGNCYLTAKEDVPLRESPNNKGKIIEYLPKGYPVESLGLFRTSKNTLWIKVKSGYSESWCYFENLEKKEHFHQYLDLINLGYNFEFCSTCGHIRAKSPDAFDVDLSASDQLHLSLAICSAVPVVGNACDLIDALYSLYEGDYASAVLGMTAALPLIGKFSESVRAGNYARYFDQMTGYAVIGYKSDNVANLVHILPEGKSSTLGKNMDEAFALTGKKRYKNVDGSARHHIVAGNAKRARPAQKILSYVGIDINDAENGIYLCMRTNVCQEGTIHAGGHSKDYYEAVNRMIKEAYDNGGSSMSSKREAVVKALDNIAQQLMEGKLDL